MRGSRQTQTLNPKLISSLKQPYLLHAGMSKASPAHSLQHSSFAMGGMESGHQIRLQAGKPTGHGKGEAFEAEDTLAVALRERVKESLGGGSSEPVRCSACRTAGGFLGTKLRFGQCATLLTAVGGWEGYGELTLQTEIEKPLGRDSEGHSRALLIISVLGIGPGGCGSGSVSLLRLFFLFRFCFCSTHWQVLKKALPWMLNERPPSRNLKLQAGLEPAPCDFGWRPAAQIVVQ